MTREVIKIILDSYKAIPTDEPLALATIEALEELMRLKDSTRWIPCDERLPKIDEEVLFQDYDGDIFVGRFHGYDGHRNVWYADYLEDRVKNVIAWMPLPQAYREDVEE